MSTEIPDELREKAREIGCRWFGHGHQDAEAIAEEVAAFALAVRNEAIAEEREACAALAEQRYPADAPLNVEPGVRNIAGQAAFVAGRKIARAIRARA